MLTGTESASSGAACAMQTSERRCENPVCNVNKLIAMVPKRKTTQFVADAMVIDTPMLVNGFTAVFQVDGSSARLMDIKKPQGDGPSKTIYRIIPNSHVHVVNYVVVDTDETYLKKITENDPATMQKLLTSQKESADQMLKKIMAGQGSSATAAMTTVVSTINNNNNSNNCSLAPHTPAASANSATASVPAVLNQNSTTSTTNPIKLPVRMHPNLKITAVASGDAVNTPPISSTSPAAPYITPVPLTNLQAPISTTSTQPLIPPLTQPLATSSSNATNTSTDAVDMPTYDKMQAEINDLRRTVAMLAEAQAKNQKLPTTTAKLAKRSKT